jgi:hypothetical protein
MASDNMKHRRLQELGESDFEIVDGQPDIRGWDVRNEKDQKIGEVEELILDAKNKKVRYLVVDLDDNDLDLDEKEVLIPIGMAELHEDDDDVVVRNLSIEQLEALPEYDEDNLTPEVERNICMALGRSSTTSTQLSSLQDDTSFYEDEQFNDSNLYRRRLPSSGTAGSFGTAGSLSSDSTGGLGSSRGITGDSYNSDAGATGSTGNSELNSGSNLGSKYDFSRGYGLRERSGISGSEVEGYTGNEGSSYGSGTLRESRGSMYEHESINEDEAVPVNRPRTTPDDTNWNKETDIDNLTGDNNRGIRGDDFNRSDDDEIRRSER